MFLTSRDLSGLGAENPAGLVEQVDYFHPVGLRPSYAFTRAAKKAQLPTEKPPAGYWYVLQKLPTGVWYYDVQPKAGAGAAVEETKPAAAAPAPAPAAAASVEAPAPASAATVPAKRASAGMPSWVAPVGIGAAVVGLISVALFVKVR